MLRVAITFLSTMKPIPTLKPTNAHRLQVQSLLRSAAKGCLATTMRTGPSHGTPYASLVTFATDHGGAPLLLLSRLSDHTQNALTTASASLLVEDPSVRPSNPQEIPRVTALGQLVALEADTEEHHHAQARFLARHPAAALYAGFGDFGFWRLDIERLHLVGGFARAVWLEPTDIEHMDPDIAAAFAAAEPGVLSHMNDDHSDAVHAYAVGLAGQEPGDWQLTACDAHGVDVTNMAADASVPVRIAFPKPAKTAADLRTHLVAMAQAARTALSNAADQSTPANAGARSDGADAQASASPD